MGKGFKGKYIIYIGTIIHIRCGNILGFGQFDIV